MSHTRSVPTSETTTQTIDVRQSWSATFSSAARAIADAARRMGLTVPSFRSPPAKPGVDRTLRRWSDGRCVVAVRAAGRPPEAVVNDLVAGVIAANSLAGERAEKAASRLRAAAADVHGHHQAA